MRCSCSVPERLNIPLTTRFESIWESVRGEKGGFKNETEEREYKERGKRMIETIVENPGPLTKKTIKLKEEVPYYWFSVDDLVILCGKIDWIEYHDNDTIGVIDFKTGRIDEKDELLQLPIYYLLANHVQERVVESVSYWYLDRSNKPVKMPIPDVGETEKRINEIAKRVKLARQLEHFNCPVDIKVGCRYCAPLKAIVDGQGKFVGIGNFGEEIYILDDQTTSLQKS